MTASEPRYALGHARLAQAYAELDMSDRAKDEMLKAGEAVPDRSHLAAADALQLDAIRAMTLREYGAAADRYSKLVSISQGDSLEGALLDLGLSLEKQNLPEKAITAYQNALAHDAQNAAADLRLAVLTGRVRSAEQAGPWFSQAEANYRLTGDFEGVAEVLLQKSVAFRNGRKLTESRTAAMRAIEMAKTTGNFPQQIRARFELAMISIGEGHSEVAAKESADSLEIARREGLDALCVSALIDLGNAAITQYQVKNAKLFFGQALDLARRTRSRAGEARASLSMGSQLLREGDAVQAGQYIDAALPFYRQGGYRVQMLQALTLVTDARIQRGEYVDAQASATELRNLSEASGDRLQLGVAIEREADILTQQGDLPKAIELYIRSEQNSRALGRKRQELYAVANRAELLGRLGRIAEARSLLKEVDAPLADLGGGGKPVSERLQLIRGAQALAWRDFPAAQRLAKASLAASDGGSPYRAIAGKQILGLAKARAGDLAAGKVLCDEALFSARAKAAVGVRVETQLAAAEAASLSADWSTAKLLAGEAMAECVRVGQTEAAYRASLLLVPRKVSSDPGELQQAKEVVERYASALRKLWGAEAFAIYQKRPDLIALKH